MEKENDFKVMVVGIIFDPATKTVLLGRRKKNPDHRCEFKWCFPGGRLHQGEEINTTFKRLIKEKTGYDIVNLGPVFSGIHPIKKDYIAVYFLSEVIKGQEKPGRDMTDLRWVKIDEMKQIIDEVYDKGLNEYLMYLK